MAVNTRAIFPGIPSIAWGTIDTANTAKDGTGTVVTVFTADAVYGSRVDFIKVRAKGTNIQTVMRVWINNGSTNATPANNTLFTERTIAATSLSETTELADVLIPMDVSLPPGYKINITIGTSVAAGLHVNAHGGEYEANAA